MNVDFIRDVGPAPWIWRTAKRQLYKRLLRRDHYMRLPCGARFLVPRSSKFASEVYVTGANVDWGSEALLFRMLQKKGAFLDVGANVGYYSLYMAPKATRVIAFEPDPRVLPHLEKNLAGRREVDIICGAVGRSPGKAMFTLEHDVEVSHLSRALDGVEEQIEVDVLTVDTFVSRENIASVEAIKIDVEGFDVDVLLGAKETMRAQRPLILTEAKPTVDLFTAIDGLSYSVYAYTRQRATRARRFQEVPVDGFAESETKMLFLAPCELVKSLINLA